MAERWHALAPIAAAMMLAGCGVDLETLSLTQVCTPRSACAARFDVELTSGIADDFLAARFGENGGELHIQLRKIPGTAGADWSLDALAASTSGSSVLVRQVTWGACGAACPPDPVNVEVTLNEEFNWAQVVVDEAGAGGELGFNPAPPDAVIIFSGANIELVALRTPGSGPEE